MIRRFSLILILALPLPLLAEVDPWDAWDAEVIRSLHTASDSEYLNEEEKKVILFMNMARYDGPLFAETFLDSYVQEKQMENSSYIRSLHRDLKKTGRLAPLNPAKDLTAVAQGHARESGKKGSTGHQGFKRRFEGLLGNPYMHVGENCSYGYEKAIDIVISLLIDAGVKELGHRNNILSTDFNSVGISIQTHKTYNVNCVMDFGARDQSGMNDVPL